MGHITHHRKGHGRGDGNTLAEVMAGCTVRARLRLTDGGVALDWADRRVSFRDIRVWSDARQGVIASPSYSVDADDPTLLVVEHTTSVSDLPGIHRLVVTVTFMGWTASHTVAAYVLSNNLVYGGTNPSGRETETELEVRLHDVSTTFLQRLIDQLLALRWGENERITALETQTQTLRSEVDALTERLDTAEKTLATLTEGMQTLTEGMQTLTETVTAARKDITSLEESKQDRLEAGENITIDGNVISATTGEGEVDLSDYYTKEQVDRKISDLDLSDYYTKEETDEKIADAGGTPERLGSADIDEIWDGIENGQ